MLRLVKGNALSIALSSRWMLPSNSVISNGGLFGVGVGALGSKYVCIFAGVLVLLLGGVLLLLVGFRCR